MLPLWKWGGSSASKIAITRSRVNASSSVTNSAAANEIATAAALSSAEGAGIALS